MTRTLAFLVHNWPLKLAAVVLATVLYSLFVLSQNARTVPVSIPVTAVNQRPDVVRVSNLDNVTSIRYFAPEDAGIRVDNTSFRATVDLSSVDAKAGAVSVPVHVQPVDDRIVVLEVRPSRITVRVDEVATRSVPVRVRETAAPTQFDVREPVLSQSVVTVRGPGAEIRRVDAAIAPVQLDPQGIDFDRDVELIPVDASGAQLREVDVEPSSVRVRIAVFTDRRTKSLPIAANVTGTPAPGFEVASVSVDPVVVNVEGDANQLNALRVATTAALSVDGATADIIQTRDLDLPTGVLPVKPTPVTVTVRLRQVTATRTFSAGIRLTGARSDRHYSISTDAVSVTIGGSIADLDRLQGQALLVDAPVAGLDSGKHDVKVTIDLPAGLALVTASPPSVVVTITTPPAGDGASPAP
ncbi:MAG: YbbR-like domain-containing protein [Chloroflexota bacterium]